MEIVPQLYLVLFSDVYSSPLFLLPVYLQFSPDSLLLLSIPLSKILYVLPHLHYASFLFFFSFALSANLSFLSQQTYPDSCHVVVNCCHGLYLPISILPATKYSICSKTAPASMSNFSYHFFWHCCLAICFYPPNISLSVICMFLIPCILIAV